MPTPITELDSFIRACERGIVICAVVGAFILTGLLMSCDIARQSHRRDHDINTRCLVSTPEIDIDCGVTSSKEQHDSGEQKSLNSPVPIPAP